MLVLGGADAGDGAGFSGQVDELRIYDRALDHAGVWRLYRAESKRR